jgi:hypothetical protein
MRAICYDSLIFVGVMMEELSVEQIMAVAGGGYTAQPPVALLVVEVIGTTTPPPNK